MNVTTKILFVGGVCLALAATPLAASSPLPVEPPNGASSVEGGTIGQTGPSGSNGEAPSPPREFAVQGTGEGDTLLTWREPQDQGSSPVEAYILERNGVPWRILGPDVRSTVDDDPNAAALYNLRAQNSDGASLPVTGVTFGGSISAKQIFDRIEKYVDVPDAVEGFGVPDLGLDDQEIPPCDAVIVYHKSDFPFVGVSHDLFCITPQ